MLSFLKGRPAAAEPPSEKTERLYEGFEDSLTVHTAPSGTQYVFPIDLLLDEQEILDYIEEARAIIEGEAQEAGAAERDE